MAVSTEVVKALREETGISVMECKKALEEAGGNREKALAILKSRAGVAVGKKSDRALGAGAVASYVHSTNQVGALVLLSCETDFVAKNEEFQLLAREVAMQVTAMRPENIEALLQQPFIKDASKTINDLVSAAVQKFGERVEVAEIQCVAVNS
jgi:elongation factor Ts